MSTGAESLVDGALKGYSFVDGIYRRKQLDEERASDKQYQRERDTKRDELYEKHADRNYELGSQRLALETKNTEQQMQNRQDDRQRMSDGLEASALFDRFSDPDYKPTEQDREQVKKFGVELAKLEDDGYKYNLNVLTNGVSNYLSGKAGGESINSPEFLDAFNKTFADKINKNFGVDYTPHHYPGGQITKKEVAGIMPGKAPGTVVIDLLVSGKDKDGKPFQYRAPATVNRSTEDDEVKQIPVDMILGDIQSRQLMATNKKMLGGVRQQLREIQIKAGLTPAERFSDPEQLGGGFIQRDSQNKAYPIAGLSRPGGGKSPAIVQEIEYYRANNKTFDEAIRLANSASPEKTRAALVQALIKDPINSGMEPAELKEKVDQYMQVIYQDQQPELMKDGVNQSGAEPSLNKKEGESPDEYISRIIG